MARISAQAPTAKAPPMLNHHLLVTSPFPTIVGAERVSDFESRRRSDLFAASARAPAQAALMRAALDARLGVAGPTAAKADDKPQLADVPIPHVLRRHVLAPSQQAASQSPVGKVLGFRIEVNGKMGTRSNRKIVHYGKLGSNDSHNSMLDFGKASFFNKKGATGVKAWVAYE
ncbi:hypothetical protein BCR33DRAFT_709531 [Rhizoclosmatium globosum]|uniref:Uncharacterized protein n=2 Tax=Rhizoclosmatium globosum TaxID=329046 RepID=A0A1Y2A4B4_9FUNG|nr:hypothetical protein BCR33DRAFT_709531 [Rhizoclosmatium globosum]|eukprot:ORY17362.1 hypothetical protein BCR33DRAFT_709531 [Rhizoclosmatium globosum]